MIEVMQDQYPQCQSHIWSPVVIDLQTVKDTTKCFHANPRSRTGKLAVASPEVPQTLQHEGRSMLENNMIIHLRARNHIPQGY